MQPDVSSNTAVNLVVLVAEDEALIRMLAVAELSDAGFTIIEAMHAADALAILQMKAEQVHVLFSDIHMPGTMNGLELAHHVHGHWPWISLLLTSGNARPHASEMPLNSRFVAKPYDLDHVISHVREMASA